MMWDFIKLTLSSNDRPTMIKVGSIVQMFEDINDGKECTKIYFESDYTRVKEDILTIMCLIRKARLNSIYGLTGGFTRTDIYTDTDSIKIESDCKRSFSLDEEKIYNDLKCLLKEYSPSIKYELINMICNIMDILTGDDFDADSDLAFTRVDMAEKIFKEWPHPVEYYEKNEPIIDEQTEMECEA